MIRMRKGSLLLKISLLLVVLTAGLARGADPAAGPREAPFQENWVALDKVLTETADSLEKKEVAIRAQVAREKSAYQALKQETIDLGAAVSTYKAALAVEKMSLPKVVDLLRDFSNRRARVTEKINKLTPELDNLKERQGEFQKTRADLQAQVKRLKDRELPADARTSFLSHFDRYQRLGSAVSDLEAQQAQLLQGQLAQWQRQTELLLDLTASLEKYREKRSTEELFKRQPDKALRVSLPRLLGEISTVPSRFISKYHKLTEPGTLSDFLQIHLHTLLGLLMLGGFLLYGVRGLKQRLVPRLAPLSDRARSFSKKFFLALVEAVVRHAYLITAALLATLGSWVLELSEDPGADILLTALGYYLNFASAL